MNRFVVVDCGTSSCRAALVSGDGKLTRSVRRPVRIDRPRPFFAEVDTGHVWQQVCAALGELMQGVAPGDVAAVGVSAMLGYVPLDRHGQPLMPAMIWMDNRARAQTGLIRQRLPDPVLYRKTGRRPAPELLAPRLLWLRENQPDIYGRTDKVIGLKDDILRRMTGVVTTDPAHLDYTLLHNIVTRQLDEEILAALDIDPAMIAPARPADQLAGQVSPTAAGETGLLAGTPVVTGSSDGTTAMYGGGVLETHAAVLVAGTTDVLMTASAAAVEDEQQALSLNTAMVPDHYLAGGATGMSGGALAAFEALFDTSIGAHASAVAALSPGSSGLLVLPGISGERAPYWMEHSSGGIFGHRQDHRIEHILRATMESTAYRIAVLLEIMTQSNLRVDTIRVVGGTAQNDAWNQIRSDVWGKTVEKTDVTEATLLGTAMFCRSALDSDLGLKHIARQWTRVTKRYTPDPKAHAAYSRLSGLFNRFINQNADLFKELNDLYLDSRIPNQMKGHAIDGQPRC